MFKINRKVLFIVFALALFATATLIEACGDGWGDVF